MNEEIKDINTEENPASERTVISDDEAEERVVIFEEALEAILFAAGHPITYAALARVFDTTPLKIKEKVIDYSLKYNNQSIPRGVILLTYGDSCQLCTKQYYLTEIRETLGIKKSGTLSTSSMEALAIVAYNQPVTRAFVDTLRRADSSYAMNNLIDRGLIESKGRLDAPGRPMLYGTTPDFLRSFGIKDISALPRTPEEIQEMFAKAKRGDAIEECIQEEIQFAEGGSIQKTAPNAEELDAINDMADVLTDAAALIENEPSAEDDIIAD
ncbi:MAG: SMC-Scp complex subunit ScpB [Clostridia bacterium]|nr:SMC-Scp complex subunit ScpB [Clostridia bacterium]